MSEVWLVLPTCNEAENIEAFVAAARAKLPASAQVLIVDDGSPDGSPRSPTVSSSAIGTSSSGSV